MGFTYRRVTHTSQNTRYNETVIKDWVPPTNELIDQSGLGPNSIINMDETNFDFDSARSSTLEFIGTKTINALASKTCKRATVILAVMLGGMKLPPFIVFKGKENGRICREVTTQALQQSYPAGVIMSVQDNAWCDRRVMAEWINRVFVPWTMFLQIDQSVLIMDDFSAHWVSEIDNLLFNNNVRTVRIPKGYTGKLQVMDVGINKPFKDYVQDETDDWMVNNFNEITEAFPSPSRQDISRRVLSSWNQISPTNIINTWKHIGMKWDGTAIVAIATPPSTNVTAPDVAIIV